MPLARVAALATASVAVAVAGAPAAHAEDRLVDATGVPRVGDWDVTSDDSLQNAIDFYGSPGARRSVPRGRCLVRWSSQGMVATFRVRGRAGSLPCSVQDTLVAETVELTRTLSGTDRWCLPKRVCVGDRVATLRRRYPAARRTSTGALRVRGGARRLEVEERRGRVALLRLTLAP